MELENIDGIGPKTKELLNKLKIYNRMIFLIIILIVMKLLKEVI